MSEHCIAIGSPFVTPRSSTRLGSSASSHRPRERSNAVGNEMDRDLHVALNPLVSRVMCHGSAVSGPERSDIPRDVVLRVVHRDKHLCQVCRGYVGDGQVEFDHIIPLSTTGGTSEANLRLLCGACKREKSANALDGLV